MGLDLSLSKFDWNEEPTAREKTYLAVVMIMIVIAFLRLLWIPSYQVIKQDGIQAKSLKAQIKTLEDFLKKSQKAIMPEPLPVGTDTNARLERALSGGGDDPHKVISGVTRDLTSRQKLGGLLLDDISFDAVGIEAGYVRIPVTIHVTGTYSSIANYLTKVEALDYFFVVENIKLRLAGDATGLIKGDLSCSLYISSAGMPATPEKKEGG